MPAAVCSHIGATQQLITPAAYHCDECIKTNSQWVHLRTCQTCAATLCCDSLPNKHMTTHYHQTQHPVVISDEPG